MVAVLQYHFSDY